MDEAEGRGVRGCVCRAPSGLDVAAVLDVRTDRGPVREVVPVPRAVTMNGDLAVRSRSPPLSEDSASGCRRSPVGTAPEGCWHGRSNGSAESPPRSGSIAAHLGCRVSACSTSQWFKCPCHGAKYRRVGEKMAGPAALRGMDRLPTEVTAAEERIVGTRAIALGPPIGQLPQIKRPRAPIVSVAPKPMSELARQLTRRRFLQLTGIAGVTTLVAGCSRAPSPAADSSEAPRSLEPFDDSFVEPERLISSDGRLEVTLRAEPEDVPWGDSLRYAYTYNGTSPGPTLQIRPGDQLIVNLENGLDTDTNLHTHGLNVSSTGDGDNVFIAVAPGESRTYRYDIPADHRSGLFWYHPHAHGHVAKQVAAGLAGAIVVVDAVDEVPELADSTERIWVLSDPVIGADASALSVAAMEEMWGREGDAITVNGIARPQLAAAAGSRERWRFVNASPSRYYQLALDSHELHVIATDGGRLAAPVEVDELLLSPGERVEVLVTPSATGTYGLRTSGYGRGAMGMGNGMMDGDSIVESEALIATLTVTGDSPPAGRPRSLLGPEAFSVPEPSASRVVELGMGMGGGMMGRQGDMMSFTIDGRTFDPSRTDITTRLGTVEEWEIRNSSPMDHPFHLHVWPFLVLDGPPSQQGWKDTVNVRAGSSVRVLVPFASIAGRSVYHCHILDHEDLGMMGVIEVTQ